MTALPPRAARSGLSLTREELEAWGRSLGAQIHPPLVIAMSGELGSGKTTLAAAICGGYGVQEAVTSPTYAIAHSYEAPRSVVHHLDLYRLKGPEDLQNIGWDEMVGANALVLIEWPERAGDRLPQQHIPVELRHAPEYPDRRVLYAGGHLGHQTGIR